MKPSFRWLETHSAVYWFAGLALVCLLAGRWPALHDGHNYLANEAQAVAASLGLPQHPTDMWGASANESGPLTVWALVPLQAVGLPANYFAARLTALLLDWVALLLGYRLLQTNWPRRSAFWPLLPVALLLSFWREPVLAAYSGAHLAVPLLLATLWLAERCRWQLQAANRVHWGWAVAAGVTLGALPWVGRDFALLPVLAILWHVWRAWREGLARAPHWSEVLKPFGVMLYVVAAALAGLHGTGQLAHFRFAYTGPLDPAAAIMPGESPRNTLPRLVLAVGGEGASLAIWGGHPQLHVATGLGKGSIYSGSALPDDAGRREFYTREFIDDLRRRGPAFFIQATAGLPRELTDEVRENYRFIGADGSGGRLYARSDWMQAAGRFERLGLRPLSFAGAPAVGVDHLLANAPSRLTHPVPAAAKRLRGRFGFEPDAYLRPPGEGTDGALFRIELVGQGGQRTTLLERRLSPMYVEADRGASDFVFELPPGQTTEVVFSIEPGRTATYDWTYWEDLRFEMMDSDTR